MQDSTGNNIVIGIGGVTNGGKTTLSEHLSNTSDDITIINMDDYYHHENDERHVYIEEFNYNNYEIVSSVDFAKIHGDIRTWCEMNNDRPHKILVVEGILIYNYPPIQEFFKLKYYFTLEKDECYKRRCSRMYLPPEPTGYFDKLCWPCHQENRQQLKDDSSIVYIDGNTERSEIYSRVWNEISVVKNNSESST